MKKEGLTKIFNSQNGKVNIELFFAVILIFVLSVVFVEAVRINQISPIDLSKNNSRNINFTFTANWTSTGEVVTNCSIWTNLTGTWAEAKTNESGGLSSNISNFTAAGTISWINFTVPADGLFNWSVACNGTGATSSPLYNFSANRSLLVDATAPRLLAILPNATLKTGAVWSTATTGNFSAGWPITFRVNITDNNTDTVWYILNASTSNQPSWLGGPSNIGYLENSSAGVIRNITMNREIVSGGGDVLSSYAINVSLNFTSSWRGPGVHSVVFCANDSTGNRQCIGSFDILISGINVTDMENSLTSFGLTVGSQTAAVGVNITFGNGTEVPAGDAFDSATGTAPNASFINPLVQNYTFIFNFSQGRKIHMVGVTLDETLLGNLSNANITSSPEKEILSAVGYGFNTTWAGADFAKFIPDFVRYKFGVIEMQGIGYDKHLYCSGSSIASPNCTSIFPCSATAFGANNDSSTLNTILASGTASACYLEGNRGGELYGTSLDTSKTYIFVKHFSGGATGNDTGGPEIQLFGSLTNNGTASSRKETPLFDVPIFNTSSSSLVINFTVADINSTGINMSINNTINVSIYDVGSLPGTARFFVSGINKNLTCTPVGYATNTTVYNITGTDVTGNLTDGVNCTVTVTGLSNGTKNITIMARDASNNTATNVNITSVLMIVDNIPPVIGYFNITNGTRETGTNGTGLGSFDPSTTPIGFGSTRQGSNITAVSNWTDNLTQPFQGALQFYNTSSGQWQTINSTMPSANYIAGQNINIKWINLTFFIPSDRNEFEGQNVSFRMIANDTVGNVNSSASATNITIQINDTNAPTIGINGTVGVNGTNISTTTVPVVSWAVNEHSILAEINVSIDNNAADLNSCNFFKQFKGTPNGGGSTDPEGNRNSSFATNPSSASICNLANGSHSVTVSARDTWGNVMVVFNNFSVQSGGGPGLQFNNITYALISAGLSVFGNNTNITSQAALNFTSPATSVQAANLTYTTSCNSTVGLVKGSLSGGNAAIINPFGCASGTSSNRTLTITVTDTAGNSNTTTFSFLVDDVAPSLSVNAPTNGFNGANNITFNVSAKDSDQRLSTFGYFLDSNIPSLAGITVLGINTTISSYGDTGTGANVTKTFNLSFKPGTHQIKFFANDTLGNVFNSSVLIFTTTGTLNFTSLGFATGDPIYNVSNTTLGLYNANVSYVNLSNSTGGTINLSFDNLNLTDQTLNLFMTLNGTAKGVNVTISFNASAANWDQYNFSVKQNDTSVINNIISNWTTFVNDFIEFNESLQNFISSNNSYYGIVRYPFDNNISDSNNNNRSKIGTELEIWYFADIRDVTSKTNVTECAAGFTVTPQLTLSAGSFPCWNNTDNRTVKIYVPHFSGVAIVNNSGAPTVNVTLPNFNQTVGMFVPNITVSADAVSCVYSINSTGITRGGTNYTMTKSGNICLGQTERFKNLDTSSGVVLYNFTFTVTDSEGNINDYFRGFNVSDSTASGGHSISSSPSTTTATVTVSSANESVNASVIYGTVNTTLSSTKENNNFNQTQTVSLTGLTAGTAYYYNVTICDFNGNCIGNGTYSFTTSAAAAAASTTTTSSSSSGGGSAVGTPTASSTNTEASASRVWDTIKSGASATLTISNEDIPVRGVSIDMKNTVTQPSLTVESLKSNPVSTPASSSVYKYIEIKPNNIADTDASKITINFEVPKSWLKDNKIGEDSIALFRYSVGKWNVLSTTKTGSDANSIYYQSTSPGFSTYAIGSSQGSAFAIIDAIRDFYDGKSKLTAFDIIDMIRSFYGG